MLFLPVFLDPLSPRYSSSKIEDSLLPHCLGRFLLSILQTLEKNYLGYSIEIPHFFICVHV